ncbi:MAG: DUF6305 family protein [Atribacterota bacterium]|jgi:hypothetical protein|nr:DUF6305 family protein [Atribacterota bacterium]MDD4897079.1 DUF6305 family protein [Atribacterota bacterium]MDD5637253.1 DUF6305 family protein [Atribacterota bacterium]
MNNMNNIKTNRVLVHGLLIILFLIIFIGTSLSADEAPQILITSIGQSPDARMINVLVSRFQIATTYEQIAAPEIIKDFKIVIAVVGGSSKGLGAAGIDQSDEITRSKTLIQEIKAREVKFLVMHIGGEARRGALSDAFLDEVVPYADHLIVVESGNKDGYFTKMSEEHKIPLEVVEKITDSGEPVKAYIEEHLN